MHWNSYKLSTIRGESTITYTYSLYASQQPSGERGGARRFLTSGILELVCFRRSTCF